jgi:hypothetical protein
MNGQRLRPGLEWLERLVLLSNVAWNSTRSGFWDVARNWSTGDVPGPNDDVVINVVGATPTATIRTAVSVHSRRPPLAREFFLPVASLCAGSVSDPLRWPCLLSPATELARTDWRPAEKKFARILHGRRTEWAARNSLLRTSGP